MTKCKGTTRAGTPCERYTTHGDYCKWHVDQAEGLVATSDSEVETVEAKPVGAVEYVVGTGGFDGTLAEAGGALEAVAGEEEESAPVAEEESAPVAEEESAPVAEEESAPVAEEGVKVVGWEIVETLEAPAEALEEAPAVEAPVEEGAVTGMPKLLDEFADMPKLIDEVDEKPVDAFADMPALEPILYVTPVKYESENKMPVPDDSPYWFYTSVFLGVAAVAIGVTLAQFV